MKKQLMMWCAMLMVVITAVSCSEKDELLNEKGEYRTLTIVATQGIDAQSRVDYVQNGENLNMIWSEGDKILVMQNNSDMRDWPIEFSLTEGADTPRGTFTYSGDVPSSWTEDTELVAYYKAGDNIRIGFRVELCFPESCLQTGNGDKTHLVEYNHMVSEPFSFDGSNISELHCKQLGAIMKFELQGLEGKHINSVKMVADERAFVYRKERGDCFTTDRIEINLGELDDNDVPSGITLNETDNLIVYLMLGVNDNTSLNGKHIKLYAFDDNGEIYDADITGGVLEAGKLYTLNKTMVPKTFWQGEGTEASPYQISTVSDLFTLKEWMNYLGKETVDLHFQLQESIDMGNTWIEFGGYYGTFFSGVFDGNGKTISNLKYETSSGLNALFGELGSGGVIKNLTISGSITENESSNAGGIVGMNQGTVIGCTNLIDIKGRHYAAGIVRGNFGKVIACVNKGNIECSAGTLSGVVEQQSKGGEIIACYNIGKIEGKRTSDNRTGGILSEAFGGSVKACYNTGTLIGDTPGNVCGRVFTYYTQPINFNNCYWSGNTYGAVGLNEGNKAAVSNCQATTNWEDAMSAMNEVLEDEGVDYRYVLNTDEATKNAEPLLLKQSRYYQQ